MFHLYGTFNFTFGESFCLIVERRAIRCQRCNPSVRSRPVTVSRRQTEQLHLDFSNSANLINIALPKAQVRASLPAPPNVTAVPEPGEWLMLLAGLGLVWRTRRKAS
jgi:hypothetical protein